MLPFTKRTKDKALTALVPAEHGLAVAAVNYEASARPVLTHCEYISCPNGDCSAEFIKKQIKTLRIANRPCTTTVGLGEYDILSVEAPDVPPAELRAVGKSKI